MKVFIDGGGNRKIGVEKYLSKMGPFDKVYVFEPNPVFFEGYIDSNYLLIKKAIWIEDCKLPFYVSKDQNQVASSLLEEKLCKVNSKIQPYFYDNPLEVDCVDFSRWINENINSNDELIVKLDIEGAEYEVLWKLIADGVIHRINKLYVEFHQDTCPSKREGHATLLSKLTECGVEPCHWD